MKKYKIILFTVLLLFLCTLAILMLSIPQTIENAVLVETNQKYSTVYIQGKITKIKAKNLDIKPLSVLSFKNNFFKAYDFQRISPITERIMQKSLKAYDLEASGAVSISPESSFYTVDKNNKIVPSNDKSIIVGKSNIKCFKDSKNNLKTFLIFPADLSVMRVGISSTAFNSIYHEKVQLTCENPVKLFSVKENKQIKIPENTAVIITENNNKTIVSFNKDKYSFQSRIYIKGENITVTNIKRGDPLFNPSYNGILEFTGDDKGVMMINEVNIEDYLKKVVPSEMPVTGGIESLKCQAVAARTYAVSDMLSNRFSNLGFYVDDSTQSQVYNNTPEKDLSTAAVDSTKGLIMTFNGNPIDAKYYSTSAGTGVGFEDAWFNSDGTSDVKPYLKTNNYLTPQIALPHSEEKWLEFYKDTDLKAIDSVSPYFRWEVHYSEDGLTACLNKSLKIIFEKRSDFIKITQNGKVLKEFPKLQDITDIKVTKRSAGGNIKEAVLIFKNAEVTLKNEYNIRTALRCSSAFTGEDTKAVSFKGNTLTNGSLLPSGFAAFEKNGDEFSVYGGGYGHGVGMSQYGAMELSKENVSFKDILNTFYKNIQYTSLY